MGNALLIVPLWLGAILLWSLGVYILAQKKYPEFRAFAFAAISGGIYCGGYAAELCASELPTMLFWSRIQYVGFLTMPYFWVRFVLLYTGRLNLLKPVMNFLLTAFPLLSILLKFFDGSLHLIYADVALDSTYNTLSATPGPWYYIIQAYLYSCGIYGVAILATFGKKRMGSYRKNAILLALITVSPLVGSAVYLSGISPFGKLDLSPYCLLVSMCLMYFAILKNDLVSVSPIARDFIFEHLPLGVLTFDKSRKLCEANETSRAILALSPNCIGTEARELFSDFYVEKMLPTSGRTALEMSINGRDFDVQTYILTQKEKKNIGWVVTLVDISDRKRAELRLTQLLGRHNETPGE